MGRSNGHSNVSNLCFLPYIALYDSYELRWTWNDDCERAYIAYSYVEQPTVSGITKYSPHSFIIPVIRMENSRTGRYELSRTRNDDYYITIFAAKQFNGREVYSDGLAECCQIQIYQNEVGRLSYEFEGHNSGTEEPRIILLFQPSKKRKHLTRITIPRLILQMAPNRPPTSSDEGMAVTFFENVLLIANQKKVFHIPFMVAQLGQLPAYLSLFALINSNKQVLQINHPSPRNQYFPRQLALIEQWDFNALWQQIAHPDPTEVEAVIREMTKRDPTRLMSEIDAFMTSPTEHKSQIISYVVKYGIGRSAVDGDDVSQRYLHDLLFNKRIPELVRKAVFPFYIQTLSRDECLEATDTFFSDHELRYIFQGNAISVVSDLCQEFYSPAWEKLQYFFVQLKQGYPQNRLLPQNRLAVAEAYLTAPQLTEDDFNDLLHQLEQDIFPDDTLSAFGKVILGRLHKTFDNSRTLKYIEILFNLMKKACKHSDSLMAIISPLLYWLDEINLNVYRQLDPAHQDSNYEQLERIFYKVGGESISSILSNYHLHTDDLVIVLLHLAGYCGHPNGIRSIYKIMVENPNPRVQKAAFEAVGRIRAYTPSTDTQHAERTPITFMTGKLMMDIPADLFETGLEALRQLYVEQPMGVEHPHEVQAIENLVRYGIRQCRNERDLRPYLDLVKKHQLWHLVPELGALLDIATNSIIDVWALLPHPGMVRHLLNYLGDNPQFLDRVVQNTSNEEEYANLHRYFHQLRSKHELQANGQRILSRWEEIRRRENFISKLGDSANAEIRQRIENVEQRLSEQLAQRQQIAEELRLAKAELGKYDAQISELKTQLRLLVEVETELARGRLNDDAQRQRSLSDLVHQLSQLVDVSGQVNATRQQITSLYSQAPNPNTSIQSSKEITHQQIVLRDEINRIGQEGQKINQGIDKLKKQEQELLHQCSISQNEIDRLRDQLRVEVNRLATQIQQHNDQSEEVNNGLAEARQAWEAQIANLTRSRTDRVIQQRWKNYEHIREFRNRLTGVKGPSQDSDKHQSSIRPREGRDG
ncbi:MAG: hypothetical protein HY862_13850 [Chloroflexi bacterium]|nr:hypothetical protein [Chloroflexota bacterium]